MNVIYNSYKEKCINKEIIKACQSENTKNLIECISSHVSIICKSENINNGSAFTN